jgi:hypothetical protein
VKPAISLTLLTLAIGVAPARAIDLSCSGEMHYYKPKHIEMTVPPGAAILDLENSRITSSVGNFRITKVADDSISFDDPKGKELVVDGTLDRVSGLMTVFWHKPEDWKQAIRYSELKCSVAKRMF